METLAELSGDVDERVEVLRRDLSSAYQYLRIAEAYRQAGRHDQALEWAQQGMAAFPTGTDRRLREFLADEYHRRGRQDEAMACAWQGYVEYPSLESYQRLRVHAERAGVWPRWREQALAHLRALIATGGRDGRQTWPGRFLDRSELVRVFLWEGDTQTAWREATEGGAPVSCGWRWPPAASRTTRRTPSRSTATSSTGRCSRPATPPIRRPLTCSARSATSWPAWAARPSSPTTLWRCAPPTSASATSSSCSTRGGGDRPPTAASRASTVARPSSIPSFGIVGLHTMQACGRSRKPGGRPGF